MKKKLLFSIINLTLIMVVGVVFGVACGDHIFSTNGGLASFVILLIVLLLPSIIYVLKDKINTAYIVVSSLFVLGEVISCVVFLVKPEFGLRNFAITEGVVTSVYLLSLLSVLAFYKVDKE